MENCSIRCSPLNPAPLLEAGVLATAAAQAIESRKHQANDRKCSQLGWVCLPVVIENLWGLGTISMAG